MNRSPFGKLPPKQTQELEACETIRLLLACQAAHMRIKTIQCEIKRPHRCSPLVDSGTAPDTQTLDELKQQELDEKEQLKELETQFPVRDHWLTYFKRLIANGKGPAVVEIKEGVCPGCNLTISTKRHQEASALDHMVVCENCDRIIFSAAGAITHVLTNEDIRQSRLPLSPRFSLRSIPDTTRIKDFWGLWHKGEVKGAFIVGLHSLFRTHLLTHGDKVKVVRIGETNDFRFEPKLVSERELERILKTIKSSERPLSLDTVVREHLSEKVRLYRLKLMSAEVRFELERCQGIYFRGDLVWHRPLAELRKPKEIPPVIDPPQLRLPQFQEPPTEIIVTLDLEAIERGQLHIRSLFRMHFSRATSDEPITITHGISQSFCVKYDPHAKVLRGEDLRQWYRINALEAGEKVTLNLRDATLHIHTEWKRDLNWLLDQLREGSCSYVGPPRDLLYGLLDEAGRALHYRDLWHRACELSRISLGVVVSTLSRYNRRLFCDIGKGYWTLAEWSTLKQEEERWKIFGASPRPSLTLPEEDELWRAVHEIEEHDLVYKLLKRIGGDLSYAEICRELAEMLNISVQHLKETSFLNVKDERLVQLSNGHWTLKEFLTVEAPPLPPPDEIPVVSDSPDRETRSALSYKTLLWLIGALGLIAVAATLYFLAKR
jgi:hypothetical protein